MAVQKGPGPSRNRLKSFTEGGWFKDIKSSLQKVTHHEFWKGSETGGKAAFQGMKTMGAEIWDKSLNPVKFIKKFDGKNTSGSVQPALDIMEKLLQAVKKPDLQSSIDPQGLILGGQLYSALSSVASKVKSKQKTEEKEKDDEHNVSEVVSLLIQTAIEKLAEQDAELADLAADELDWNEIYKISEAYNNNTAYESTVMPPLFVTIVNELIPIFRQTHGGVV